MARDFRTAESYIAERITRDMVASFLRERGFRVTADVRTRYGKNQSQTIKAVDELGVESAMGVRLCWRNRGSSSEERFAAVQLLARFTAGDWVGSLTQKAEREAADGKTHLLVVERLGNAIRHAALIPIASLVPIWVAQRDASQRLLDGGRLPRRKSNHAMNGASPTLYRREEDAPEVPKALWDHPDVCDLAAIPVVIAPPNAADDSIDDLASIDYAAIGSDGRPRVQRITSQIPRDAAVRRVVLERSGGGCERPGCSARREYQGFLDVHHILGAEVSDRAWTCVAVSPNCHREAHAAPNRDSINGDLLAVASQFRDV